MSQPIHNRQSQSQDNLAKNNSINGDLNFAPVQIGTKIETLIVDSSFDKVTQRKLNKNSPYQGLKRFNVKDRECFFGRDKLINRLFEAVNRSSLTLVLGASGSGKSSVVRAGLIPELKKSLESQTFYDFIFTPDRDPFDSLYRCLLSEEKDYNFSKSQAEIALTAQVDTLDRVITNLKNERERWLIFVDQFEELFTICKDVDKRNNFIASLVRVAKSGNSSVKIVLAMRSDFLEQLSAYPDLGRIANQNNIHLVTEMYPDELRQAIEQPAAKHGVVFEAGLITKIIQEVEGQKGYLPLLQYTLNLLWESECQTLGINGRPHIEDRVLNQESYAVLEGVRGALQKRVNKIYHELKHNEQTITKQIFLKLVNIIDTDLGSKAVSRRAYRNEFVGESVQQILNKFIDENLLISSSEHSLPEELRVSEDRQQSATVEIAHEILLSSWDVLKRLLEQEKEVIILKNWLASETRRWQKIHLENKSKAHDELLKGTRLAQALEFRKKDAFKNIGGLRSEENEFIDASIAWRDRQVKEEKRGKSTRRIFATTTIAIFLLALAVPLTLAGNILSTLQRRSNVIFARPGQQLGGSTNYRLTYSQALVEAWQNDRPERRINQIVFGIPGETKSTDCIFVGNVLNENKSDKGEENMPMNFTAPTQPGVYYIHFGNQLQNDCDRAKARWQSESQFTEKAKWQVDRISQTEKSKAAFFESVIGIVIVGNYFDTITHWPEIASAFYNNPPNTHTQGILKKKGSIYISLMDFTIDPNHNSQSEKKSLF